MVTSREETEFLKASFQERIQQDWDLMNLAIKWGHVLNFLFSSTGRFGRLRPLQISWCWDFQGSGAKISNSMSPFCTCIQQCKDLMDNQTSGERNERREPNISIDFCISCPPLTGSSQLKVTAITSLVAEGRKRSSESNDLPTAMSRAVRKAVPVFCVHCWQ